jgi:hypothetical protein
MRKIKVIATDSNSSIQSKIDEWMNSDEAKGINIISVNGSMDSDEDNVTYILYEPNPSKQLNPDNLLLS